MSINPLEQRLGTIVPETAQQVPDIPEDTTETADTIPAEPVQVAGPVSSAAERLLRKTITKAGIKAERNLMPDAARLAEGELAAPMKAGRFKVMEAADEKLTADVTQAIEARKAAAPNLGKPSPSVVEAKAGIPEEAFNLPRYQTEDAAAIVAGVSDALGIKTKAVTFDEIKAKAAESGISENFLGRLVGNDGRMMANAVETYKALEVLESSANELDRLFKMVADGSATDIDKLKLRQQISFHGLLQKGVKGMQTETARALAVFRIPREGNAAMVRQVLDEYGGDDALTDMAGKYLTLESRAARNAMVEKSMASGIKDVWFSTYINGLLSGPATHAKNIVSNTMFGLYQIPERYVASLYSNYAPKGMRAGELPSGLKWWGDLVPGSAEDKYAMSETLTMANSLVQGMKEGLVLASKSWKTGQANDLVSKIEMQRGLATPPISSAAMGIEPDKWLGKAVDYYGTVVTAPGRALLSEDEFFKGTLYRMDLNAQIQRRTEKTYRDAIESGMADADAMALAEKEALDLHTNPPSDMDRSAAEFAQRGTFTSELPPNLKTLQKIVNNPFVKVVVPFFKTPANIGLEVVERTPFAPLSSRWREDMAKGGMHRDMAMAKMTLGSALLATFGSMAIDGTFTGRGPERKADRDAWMRDGKRPYSMKIGDSYYSYSGLEPIGALMAIASDYAEYANNSDDDSAINEVFIGASFGIYSYLSEQPYMQGAADVVNLVMGRRANAGESVDGVKFFNELSKQMGNFAIGGSPLGAYSSAVASIDRLLDPTNKDARANPDLPIGVRGFVEAFNRYRSRLPIFSNDLPESLNLWGDPVLRSNGNLFELVSPTKVSPSQFSEVDDKLWRMGSPISMPNKKIDGVELTAEQMNRLQTIYGKELNAKDEFSKMMSSPAFDSLPVYDDNNPGQSQQGAVQALHGRLMKAARNQLIIEYPELQDKFADLHELRMTKGKYAKPE